MGGGAAVGAVLTGRALAVMMRPEAKMDRIAAKLQEFVTSSRSARALWQQARRDLTPELRSLTAQLLDGLERGQTHDQAVVESVPLMIEESLSSDFLDVFGDLGPPRMRLIGDDPSAEDRRRRVVALLRMGLEAASRVEGLEVLGRVEASMGQVEGLGPNFMGWLYVLSPGIFPPVPRAVIRGAQDAMAGSGGIVDSARKVWQLADRYGDIVGDDDLGVAAAFLGWVGEEGPDALAVQGEVHYGIHRLLHDTLLSQAFVERIEGDLRENGQLLFTGPPGTGKTYTALQLVRYLTREGGEHCTLRAHPGLGYSELVGRPGAPGHLVRVAQMAAEDPRNVYPVLLDDIHLLDIRQAFGELSAAFEFPGQRVTLSGGEGFRLPTNLMLIGTARASLGELLAQDFSFFRRFSHAAFEPDPQKLSQWLNRQNDPIKRVDLVHAFRNLNRLLRERGVAPLGHGYLMVEGLSDDNVNDYWDTHVLPYVRSNLAGRNADLEVYRLARLV